MDQQFENNGNGMRISREVLEEVCKKMIRMILFCLPDAFRGTIYSVGPIPDLRTIRIASGRRNGKSEEIIWGAANPSDYDYPGKVWDVYRDRPGGILEAMAWCVERQKSWTAENPENNIRCVRKQLEGKAPEDYHHMEPVLVKKTDLWYKIPSLEAFPEDSSGKPIWEDSLYATVAVIKIHFLPGTIKQGDRSTRIIKELSHSLGTEMLSLHARELVVEKEKRLVEEREETCNTLAHEFRNLLVKMASAYRIANNEVAYLRELWEEFVHTQLPEQPNKKDTLLELNDILKKVESEYSRSDIKEEIRKLANNHEQLRETCLLPQQNEMWIRYKIEPIWSSIFAKSNLDPSVRNQVDALLTKLKESINVVVNPQVIADIDSIPAETKSRWVELAYKEINGHENGDIKSYIEFLDNSDLHIPHRKQSRKNLVYLKTLIEMIPEIEKNLNHRLDKLKNGRG